MRTHIWAGLAAAALTVATPAAAQNAPQEFHIGLVASLTGAFNGPAKDTVDGFDAWVKGRGLPGKKIVIDTLDDETNPVSASNAFRKLAGDPKTNIIFLNINSSSALAAKAFASEFKVPIITGGGADALGFPPDPWMFKVAPVRARRNDRCLAVHAEEGDEEASLISTAPTPMASTMTKQSRISRRSSGSPW